MAAGKEYLNSILDQLSDLDGITCRQMMGEYIIYYRGKIADCLCDDRLLVKPVQAALDYVDEHVFEPAHEGTRDMLLVNNGMDWLCNLFTAIYDELPEPKSKKKIGG